MSSYFVSQDSLSEIFSDERVFSYFKKFPPIDWDIQLKKVVLLGIENLTEAENLNQRVVIQRERMGVMRRGQVLENNEEIQTEKERKLPKRKFGKGKRRKWKTEKKSRNNHPKVNELIFLKPSSSWRKPADVDMAEAMDGSGYLDPSDLEKPLMLSPKPKPAKKRSRGNLASRRRYGSAGGRKSGYVVKGKITKTPAPNPRRYRYAQKGKNVRKFQKKPTVVREGTRNNLGMKKGYFLHDFERKVGKKGGRRVEQPKRVYENTWKPKKGKDSRKITNGLPYNLKKVKSKIKDQVKLAKKSKTGKQFAKDVDVPFKKKKKMAAGKKKTPKKRTPNKRTEFFKLENERGVAGIVNAFYNDKLMKDFM